MNLTEASRRFSSQSVEEKMEFLTALAHEITILTRDSYEVGTVGLTRPARVRALNEVQHRVLGFLLALVKDSPARYPDDALVEMILEPREDPELQRQLHGAFTRLMQQMTSAA
jgi:hypothetical protein